MAANLKVDTAESTANSYTRVLLNESGSGAFRECYYYDDGFVSIKDAVDEFYDEHTGAYPGTSIPLASVTGYRLAPNIVRIVARYAYGAGGSLTMTADEMTRSDSGYMTFKTWHKPTTFDELGRPMGPLNFEAVNTNVDKAKNRNLPPRPIYIQVPFQTVRIRTVLGTNPTNAVISLLGSINDNNVTYAGKTYAAGTIQFQRLLVDPFEEDGGVKYRVEYTMAFRKSLWVVELEPKWNGTNWVEDPQGSFHDGTNFNNWYAAIAGQATFAGALPVHV